MGKEAGILRLGRRVQRPAIEVPAGEGKFDTAGIEFNEPTSPGKFEFDSAVDNRVLPSPAGARLIPPLPPFQHAHPVNLKNWRVQATLNYISHFAGNPKISDDHIVSRAKGILR